jgi:hypothetical protein
MAPVEIGDPLFIVSWRGVVSVRFDSQLRGHSGAQ